MPRRVAPFLAVPLLALPLLVGAASRAHATPYDISFTPSGTGVAGFSASGSFDYTPASGFSNFQVTWDSVILDLTSSANNPTINNSSIPGSCPTNGLSGSAYTFHMLTVCNTGSFTYGQSGIGANFEIGGGYFGVLFGGQELPYTEFTFPVAAYLTAPPTANQVNYLASFQVTAVPEPASAILLATGLVGLVGLRRRR